MEFEPRRLPVWWLRGVFFMPQPPLLCKPLPRRGKGESMIRQGALMNYIGGRWCAAGAGEALPVRNPATGEVLASVPLSAAGDVAKAVEAAEEALPAWR